jgi:hypothetical protein
LNERVELWRSQKRGALPGGTATSRYVDGHGQTLRQVEVCGRHVDEIVRSGVIARDMR